jgi:HAE1 family hydrophobic/amphiphilic exporter-1
MLSSKFLKVDKSKQNVNGFSSVLMAEGGQTNQQDSYKRSFIGRVFRFDTVLGRFNQVFEKILLVYERMLGWTLKHRKKTVAIATLAFFVSMASIGLVGTEFFPADDQGFVQIDIRLADGAELENTVAIMDEIEGKMQGIPEIETIFLEAGYTGDMMGSARGNRGTMYVKLPPLSERKRGVVEISDDIRSRVIDTPGAKINVAPMESMGMGSGGAPINISIHGDDLDTLKTIGDDFVKILKGIEGTREVASSYEDGIPEVEINIDRANATEYGLSAAQIAQAVRGVISGTTATRFKHEGTEIDVVIKGDEYFNENLQGLGQIPINTGKGFPVALEQVADISIKRGPVAINRDDQERVLTVSSQLSGRDVGSVSKDIQAALAQYQMPDTYYYQMGGEQQDMVEAFSDLGLALILAVVLVYMVMASQFESLLFPFIIMFAMPLGFAGGIFGLFMTNTPLSVPAVIGLIMLSGIVVNNAIVLVDYINTRRRVFNEDRNTAITKAGPIRLRPIMMTALTTVLAMVPLAMGMGEGSMLSAPLAIVVVWGLCLSTLVTLLVIPVMYTLLDDLSNKVKGKFKGKKKPSVPVSGGSGTAVSRGDI